MGEGGRCVMDGFLNHNLIKKTLFLCNTYIFFGDVESPKSKNATPIFNPNLQLEYPDKTQLEHAKSKK